MSNENETQCQIRGVQILDADGWRGRDGRDWTDPISLAEFQDRLATCTQRSVAAQAIDSWPEPEGTFDEVLERAAQARFNDGTQPAGEHHTGTLNLTGEGNAPASPINDDLVKTAAEHMHGVEQTYFGPSSYAPHIAQMLARAALEAAYPAIRQQVAEEIAVGIEERSALIYHGNRYALHEAVEITRQIGDAE